MNDISLFTDGSCDKNPGPGGYAAIIIQNGEYKEIAGSVSLSTINRMELQAVIAGLSEIKDKSNVTVYTDSGYIERAFNEGRVEVWQKYGWKSSLTGKKYELQGFILPTVTFKEKSRPLKATAKIQFRRTVDKPSDRYGAIPKGAIFLFDGTYALVGCKKWYRGIYDGLLGWAISLYLEDV